MNRYMRFSLEVDGPIEVRGARIRWYNKKYWIGFTYIKGMFDYYDKISNCDNKTLKELIKRDGF